MDPHLFESGGCPLFRLCQPFVLFRFPSTQQNPEECRGAEGKVSSGCPQFRLGNLFLYPTPGKKIPDEWGGSTPPKYPIQCHKFRTLWIFSLARMAHRLVPFHGNAATVLMPFIRRPHCSSLEFAFWTPGGLETPGGPNMVGSLWTVTLSQGGPMFRSLGLHLGWYGRHCSDNRRGEGGLPLVIDNNSNTKQQYLHHLSSPWIGHAPSRNDLWHLQEVLVSR